MLQHRVRFAYLLRDVREIAAEHLAAHADGTTARHLLLDGELGGVVAGLEHWRTDDVVACTHTKKYNVEKHIQNMWRWSSK